MAELRCSCFKPQPRFPPKAGAGLQARPRSSTRDGCWECCPPSLAGWRGEGRCQEERDPQSCLQILSTPVGNKQGEEEPIKKYTKKEEINKHHPAWLHLPLIYSPAEKPGCPQLLGSQLLFAMISSPLLLTWHLHTSQLGPGGSGGSVPAGMRVVG